MNGKVADWFRGPEVAVSLYAADFSKLGEQVNSLLDAGARIFHFDVGDGHFIPDITMGPVVLKSVAPMIHGRSGLLGCHLMVEKPERQFERLKKAGADSVSFHAETCARPVDAVRLARELGLGVGIAFSPETPVERAAEVVSQVSADFTLCMSIHPGLSGQAFLPSAFERIRLLRNLLPTGIIEVDGGVNLENISDVKQAGADLIVAGSAVFWTDDPGAAYRALRAQLLILRPS